MNNKINLKQDIKVIIKPILEELSTLSSEFKYDLTEYSLTIRNIGRIDLDSIELIEFNDDCGLFLSIVGDNYHIMKTYKENKKND